MYSTWNPKQGEEVCEGVSSIGGGEVGPRANTHNQPTRRRVLLSDNIYIFNVPPLARRSGDDGIGGGGVGDF